MVNFGDRLITLLQQRHVNRTEIAHSIGVTPQAVQQWTDNVVAPKDGNLAKLCKALAVPSDYFSEANNIVSMSRLREKFQCELDIKERMKKAQTTHNVTYVYKPDAFGDMTTCDYVNPQSAVKLLLLDTSVAFINNVEEIKAALYDLMLIERRDLQNVFSRNYCVVILHFNGYPVDEDVVNGMIDEIANGTGFQIYATRSSLRASEFITQCLHQQNPLSACK